jgi:flagellar biogenesis protein FliO
MEVLLVALAGFGLAGVALADPEQVRPQSAFTPSSGMVVLAENDWDDPPEPVTGPPASLADVTFEGPPGAEAPGSASAAEPVAGPVAGPAPDAGEDAAVIPPPAKTIPKPDAAARTIPAGGSTTPWYRRGPVALGAVLAVIIVGAWLTRRYVPSVKTMNGAGPVQVVGRAYLSPKQTIALVQVGKRHVLVGVTPERITNLGHIRDPNESFELKVEASQPASKEPAPRFEQVLASESSEYADLDAIPLPPAPDNGSQLRETMGELRSLMGRLRTLQQTPAEAADPAR